MNNVMNKYETVHPLIHLNFGISINPLRSSYNHPSISPSFIQSFIVRPFSSLIHQSVRPSIHPSIHPSTHPSINPSKRPSFYQSIHKSVQPFIHSSIIHSTTHLSIYRSNHPGSATESQPHRSGNDVQTVWTLKSAIEVSATIDILTDYRRSRLSH